MRCKLINGSLVFSESFIKTDGEQIFNPTEEMWLENGWKLFIDDGCGSETAIPYYEETETEVIIRWKEI